MSTINTSFKYFDDFNLFVFSRSKNNQTHFLLRKKLNTTEFTHFRGNFNKQEPSILLALAKKFVRKTDGLLHSQNLQYFSTENPMPFDSADITIETSMKFARPPRSLTPALDDICKLVCESPYVFQDTSNTATYFIEVPMLDLEKLNEFAASKGLTNYFKYFTVQEIVEDQFGEISRKVKGHLYEGTDLMQYTGKYIINYTPIEMTGFYGVICCEMFIKTHLLHALYYPTFKKHGERWKFYKAFEKDLPTEEELKELNGLIIPGSMCSANNPHVDWYQGLFALIRKIHYQYPNIKLLGVCFGAQAIAQALGGKVDRMNREFVDGGEILQVSSEFYDLPFVKKSQLDAAKQLIIAEAHNDHIVELPPMAKHYASSENTNVEVFTINNNILAFQGHPDYNEVMVVRSGLKNKNLNVRNYLKYEESCIKAKFSNSLTQKETLEICFNFLKQSL